MAGVFLADSTEPLGAVLIERRKVEQQTNPDIDFVDRVFLKSGPRAYKVAVQWVIRDRNTGEVHHHAVTIEAWSKTKKNGWVWERERTITLDDQDGDETIPLETFLGGVHGVTIPTEPGHYLVVPVTDQRVSVASVRELLHQVSAGGKVDVIAEFLSATHGDPDLLHALAARLADDPDRSRETAAALNLARFSRALAELERLIASDATEARFQALLGKNPWMFGSEYSELLPRRNWTRDEQQDFVLRRTVDGYLEIIEIKRPLRGEPLFVYDKDHKTYYPQHELSKVLGQVLHYLEKLDRGYYPIKAEDRENVTKIRAKIIIGRDGDGQQTEALCRLNGHLHRIEVLTFDQLARVAREVLRYLRETLPASEVA